MTAPTNPVAQALLTAVREPGLAREVTAEQCWQDMEEVCAGLTQEQAINIVASLRMPSPRNVSEMTDAYVASTLFILRALKAHLAQELEEAREEIAQLKALHEGPITWAPVGEA